MSTSEDQYPSIRAWCISLVVITTVVMWIWPFEYFMYVWHVLHIKNSEVLLINLVLALVRPAVSLVTAVAGVRLYESSRPIRSPGCDIRNLDHLGFYGGSIIASRPSKIYFWIDPSWATLSGPVDRANAC